MITFDSYVMRLNLSFKSGDDLYAKDLQAIVDAVNGIDVGEGNLRYVGKVLRQTDLKTLEAKVGDIYTVLWTTNIDGQLVYDENSQVVRSEASWVYLGTDKDEDLSAERGTYFGWRCLSERDYSLQEDDIKTLFEK